MRVFRYSPLCLLLAVLLGAVPACNTHRNCVPNDLANPRNLIDLDLPPDAHAPVHPSLVKAVQDEFRLKRGNAHPPGTPPYNFLACSGGGLYGAFGAGVLFGWTEAGTRPPFDVVTGISVGGLMATFAFLGPEYDGVLRQYSTGITMDDLARRRSVFILPFADSLFSAARMTRLLEEAFTPEILCAVAKAHAAGRRLYVGTTDLDTSRLIIWDMGEIASRGTPEALALFREVSRASAAVPGAFPPVRIPVEINGTMYEELHVDGGASDEVIFRPFMVSDLNRRAGRPGAIAPAGSTLYIINNGKLYADPKCVRPRILPQVSASVRSMIYGKGRDEYYRIFLNCLETGVEFRLTAIPDDLPLSQDSLRLTPAEQQALVATGEKIGRVVPNGPGWRDLPPGTETSEQALPRAGTRFISRRQP
jgi:hypothetical protein